MAPRTKTISQEERRLVQRHLRRAPTPSGLYGCKCLNCGGYFGSRKEDAKFCSRSCNNTYSKDQFRKREREAEAKRAEVEATTYDRPLNEMQYTLSRGWSMAVDPRAVRADEEVGQEEEGWDLPDG